jgi:thiamine pyrophosphate-dependent acetolactate synthase large subunit-like protein
MDRRDFLKSAAAVPAAAVTPPAAAPQPPSPVPEASTIARPGSDFMVDILKSLDFEYAFSNPANTFRSLHESIINYGGNTRPEFITCTHEEIATAMAHGYAKIEGRPALVAVHGTVGTQHATMAVYDAFCDRVPVYLILGNHLDAMGRRSVVTWSHSAQDAAAILRDFTKWDDAPGSLAHFAESAVRAYKIATTPPMAPVAIVADADLQEHPCAEGLRIPKLAPTSPPQGDAGAVAEVARLLVAAENPVIVVDRMARTPAGLARLVELADLVQAAVVDRKGRMNFPTRHPLNQTNRTAAALADADLILGLEVRDLASAQSRRAGATRVGISADDLFTRSNYQEFQRYAESDLAIAADGEATLPAIIEAAKKLITADRRRVFDDRRAKLATAHAAALDDAREAAAQGWDSSPISTARLCAEVWAQVKDADWSLVADVIFMQNWPLRLWAMDKHYHYIGGPGGYGVGYGAPAAVGAALANKKHGRLTVNFQYDGDLMFAPGALWTAAHHRIPLLTIMHNNRAYHQEVMEVQRMALDHGRNARRAHIGTKMEDPPIDFAKLAQSMGVYGDGPISNPKDLGPAIKRAIDVVKRGEPALVDVLTQPR